MLINVKKWGMIALTCGFLGAMTAQEPSSDDGTSPSSEGTSQSPGGKPASGPTGPGPNSEHDTVDGPIIKRKVEPESVWQPKIDDPPIAKGIRFTFKDMPAGCPEGVYMILNKDKCAKLRPIIGLVGPRLPLPSSRIISVYSEPIDKGKVNGKKIITAQVPQGMGEKLIGVVVPSKDGTADLFFVDETKLEPGTVFLRNLTAVNIGLQIDQDKIINLKPGQSELFAPGYAKGGKNVHVGKLHLQDPAGKWYVSRQFALECKPLVSEIALFVWNDSIQKPELQKVSVAQENFSRRNQQQPGANNAPKANRPGASPENPAKPPAGN